MLDIITAFAVLGLVYGGIVVLDRIEKRNISVEDCAINALKKVIAWYRKQ